MRVSITKVVPSLVMCAALGCAAENRTPERPMHARTGTQRMADTLAVINAQGIANPEGNIFLNRERADELRALITGLSGTEALNKRHWMAEERLKAGQTREAIDELEKLIEDAGVSRDTITPQLKPVFDLLAIAYLRLGEQENCLTNPAANVCILPLKGAAQHKLQEGARGAIARYTQLLQQYPDDRSSQWLLNMAYLAIGGYPDSIPRRYLVPNLAPRTNDPFPPFQNIAAQVGLAVTQLAGGLSVDDFNGDGHLDLFITSWDITQPIHLFLADGHGGYVDHTANAGLDGIVGGLNTVDADYDNDSDVDILVLRGAWLGEAGKYPKSLLRNRGDGTFEDVTFESGLLSFHPTQTAAWADFDLDGYVDIFIGHESYANSLGGPSHRSELW
ncbi:MAG: FG-GAP-like repeat-containing protein, partial [Gemmatimonadaceae bacterium]